MNLNPSVPRWLWPVLVLGTGILTWIQVLAAPPQLILPKAKLNADEVAVVVNDKDPLSVQIADYYVKARRIPAENVIHVRINPRQREMPPDHFIQLKQQVDNQVSEDIQAFVLTWVQPYRAGCMSITTAFSVGFDEKWCSNGMQGCVLTARSDYYISNTVRPFTDLGIRPTMALAAKDFEQAKALIDRGVASDGTWPDGTAYLLDTSDKRRTVRAVLYPRVEQLLGNRVNISILHQDYLYDRNDVLFYFTGHKWIEGLDTLDFIPGAIADHLTSNGGELTRDWQMSALRWLEAGATGSYGATREPCNYIQKFPNPGLVISFYLQGATLLEAYSKSVAMPGDGIFIGEPLAAPFSGYRIKDGGDRWILKTHELPEGRYRLMVAPSPVGPFEPHEFTLSARPGQTRFELPKLDGVVYRLQPLASQ